MWVRLDKLKHVDPAASSVADMLPQRQYASPKKRNSKRRRKLHTQVQLPNDQREREELVRALQAARALIGPPQGEISVYVDGKPHRGADGSRTRPFQSLKDALASLPNTWSGKTVIKLEVGEYDE